MGGNVDGKDGQVAIPAHPGQPGPPTQDPVRPWGQDDASEKQS